MGRTVIGFFGSFHFYERLYLLLQVQAITELRRRDPKIAVLLTGYLCPPGGPRNIAEGIFAALGDRASRPRVQAQALQYVETERSWVHSVARYAPIYDRLVCVRQ